MVILIITTIVFILCLAILTHRLDKDTKHQTSNAFALTFLIVSCFTFCILLYIEMDKISPKAIDVYRGNTTLDITYKISNHNDTISVDSTVNYK